MQESSITYLLSDSAGAIRCKGVVSRHGFYYRVDDYSASNTEELVLRRARREDTSFMAVRFKAALIAFAVVTLGWLSPCVGQTPPPAPVPTPAPGTITGTIVDQSGAVVAGARVQLTRTGAGTDTDGDKSTDTSKDQSPNQEARTGGDGQFSFANIAPGAFQLTITQPGFAPQTSSGTLLPGEIHTVPQIALAVAANVTDVEVTLSQTEVAEEQIKAEEKQRVIGIIPNFYVSYDPHAVSLTSKQKFKLAAKTVVDPFTFLVVAGTAGIEQAQNHFIGYGQGVQGYAKRFGATYGDTLTGTFIGGAILPSILKQDPRYFYKGTGSVPSRFLYAIGMSVICKGDNGRWQPNYSGILGSLAAGGISNLYYPSQDRDSASLTFENAAIGMGSNAVTNLLQEFVIRKLTPHTNRNSDKP